MSRACSAQWAWEIHPKSWTENLKERDHSEEGKFFWNVYALSDYTASYSKKTPSLVFCVMEHLRVLSRLSLKELRKTIKYFILDWTCSTKAYPNERQHYRCTDSLGSGNRTLVLACSVFMQILRQTQLPRVGEKVARVWSCACNSSMCQNFTNTWSRAI